MLRTRWRQREQSRDKRFTALVLDGLRRLLAVLGDDWKRRPTTPEPEQDGTHTDQR